MDFGSLLHKAQKNEKNNKNQPVKYYSTKFEPPKKEQRTKQLSENIKKFLAKKEAEERQKREEANRKREELLALRAKDKKATRRVSVMLKRTKSANQSVIADAIDRDNTSVTLAGSAQPDEDDYGYVSKEAAAFYNKMMEKYSKMPQEEPKFSNRKKTVYNLNNTKERVKQALEEVNLPPGKRHKKADIKEQEDKTSFKQKTTPPPPPINFTDLLKIAEKKQFEPIIIEPKVKEEEKLLTKKQKKEMEREKEWRDRKEGRLPPLPTNPSTPTNINNKVNNKSNVNNKIIKTNSVQKISEKVAVSDLRKGKKLEKSDKTTNKEKIVVKSVPLPQKLPVNTNRIVKNPLRKEEKPKQVAKRLELKKPMKRMIINDDEDEYDSELDDFIDDGPENEEDYSKHIKEIFGYDKTRYRNAIEEDDDNMESTFAQQMREEVISTKIGIMEDLEDMKKEEEEKKRKMSMRKKIRS